MQRRRAAIPVGNTPDALTEATADLAFALLMAAARRIPEAAAFAHSGQWQTWEPGSFLGADIYGATIGIIGLGRIGQAVARRAVRLRHGGPDDRDARPAQPRAPAAPL